MSTTIQIEASRRPVPTGRSPFLLILILCLVAWPALAQNPDRIVPAEDVVTRVVVRASATSQSADRGSIRPGESAELLGSVPNWYEVRLANGVEGFVSKRWTRVVPGGGAPDGQAFTIDVVDVGTGLGVVIRGDDFTLVYDAGSNDDRALGADNRMLVFLQTVAPTLTTIDHLVLSHPPHRPCPVDARSVGGVPDPARVGLGPRERHLWVPSVHRGGADGT